jgi:RNA polymerase sigma-70 factor (ECF subfamily)
LVHQLRQQASGSLQINNQSRSDDWALVTAVLKKDRKASAEFVARFADGLYSYVRFRLAPRYDHVEDLVQETFLAAWENLSRYESSGSLYSWLQGIARHKVEDYYRACLRAPDPVEDEDEDGSILASPSKVHELMEQNQLRIKTQQVLASLPEQYRLALAWKYWDKASAREMASKTGKTEKAIERLLARARAEFRERWNGDISA